MKYGETFLVQSVPQWAAYNLDYNALKHLIKVNTTRDQATGIAIPGQADTALQKFEESFFLELHNQHDRVDLFVQDKAGEVHRRLRKYRKDVERLVQRCAYDNEQGKRISRKRQERFAKLDLEIERCGEDVRSLQRFTIAQRMAFHKLLKKYKKWTGSRFLGEKFNDEVLGSPKSFVRRDFQPLEAEYHNLLATLSSSTPPHSDSTTPNLQPQRPSRQPSAQVVIQLPPPQEHYWNEYDDGSEGGDNEPYTIYVDPDAESFPGAKTIAYIFSQTKKPMESISAWLSPNSSPTERRPLLTGDSYSSERQSIIDTDVDDETYASSSDFPAGYATHYATFPSVNEQKYSRYREYMLFYVMLGCFGASLLLLLVAGILVITGKNKLRVEVDAGVFVGVISSLFFAAMGVCTLLYRKDNLGWLYRTCVGFTCVTIMFLNFLLLSLVINNK